MALEETYPGLTSRITTARDEGYSDEEINGYIRGKMRDAFKEGYSTEDVQSYLDTGKEPSAYIQSLSRPGVTAKLTAGRAETPAMVSAYKPPIAEPGRYPSSSDQLSTETFSDRLSRLAAGPVGDVVESLLEGLAKPVRAVTEHIVKPLIPFPELFKPETYATEEGAVFPESNRRIMEAISQPFPEILSKPITEGLEATRKVSPGAAKLAEDLMITGMAGARPHLPIRQTLGTAARAFERVKGRVPTSQAEVAQAIREEPAFVEALKEERTKARIEQPSPTLKRAAPVEWVRWQETPGLEPEPQWNLTRKIKGYPKGSTVGPDTLRKIGIEPPEPPVAAPIRETAVKGPGTTIPPTGLEEGLPPPETLPGATGRSGAGGIERGPISDVIQREVPRAETQPPEVQAPAVQTAKAPETYQGLELPENIRKGLTTPGTKDITIEPKSLTAKEVVERIEDQQAPEHFDKAKITKQVEKSGETYVKTEVDPNALKVPGEKTVEPGISAPEKGAVVVDDKGKVIDGRHRTVDAKEAGETAIEAYVPESAAPDISLTKEAGPKNVAAQPTIGRQERMAQLEASVREGEQRLKSRVNAIGEKLSAPELKATARATTSARRELNKLRKEPAEAPLPRADDILIAERTRGTDKETVIRGMLEVEQEKGMPAWSDGDYVYTRTGKFRLKKEGGPPEFENKLSEEGVLRNYDPKDDTYTSSNRVIRDMKAEQEAGMESRRLAEETRLQESHQRINQWREAQREREQAYLGELDAQAKKIKFKRGSVEIAKGVRAGEPEKLRVEGVLLSDHFAIFKPETGKGWNITHRGTGLMTSEADTIQHAKRIVAGLENLKEADWTFTDAKAMSRETSKAAGPIGYGMRGRAVVVPENFKPITEPPFSVGDKVTYKETRKSASYGWREVVTEHEATVTKVYPDGSVDLKVETGKKPKVEGVSPEDLELREAPKGAAPTAETTVPPAPPEEIPDISLTKEAAPTKGVSGYPETEPETVGFPELRVTPKDVPQSISPLERNYQPPSVTSEQPIVRRGDIIRDLQDALQVPIRVGHGNFAQMKASGFFKIQEEVIRLKKANNMETAAHEIGHYISKRFLEHQFSGLKGGGRQFDKELVGMGHDLYGSRKPNHGYAEEGIAEFVKFYVTDPGSAAAKAPKFSAFFDDLMDTKFPDLRDTLHQARDNWKRYQEQPAIARVLSQISVNETRPQAITLDDLYKRGIDDLHYIKVFEDRMTKGQSPLRASDSPYTLARVFRDWTGKVDTFFKIGPIDFDTMQTIPGGKPLNEILAPFEKAGKLDDLRAYLAARSAADRIKLGQETGFNPADIKATLDTYNPQPEFVRAAENVRAYEDSLLNYAQKEGMFSPEQVAAMRERHPNHIPFMRVIESEGPGGKAGSNQKFANVGSPIKRAKGSAREIIDPLESLVKETYTILSAVDRNEVGRKLVDLAESTEGMGKYVEKVPRDKIPVTIKDFELDNLLRRYGKIKETTAFKTSRTEFTKETGVGGEGVAPTSRPAALIESRVKEALINRGFSEGEAKLYIERLKSAKTETAINSVIEKIITEQTIKTVTKELELDLPPEVVAAFRPDPKIPGMDNILSVRKNGKAILYQVHPELYEAMAGLDRTAQNALITLLRVPAQTLRLGATALSPEFAGPNVFRDQWTAAMYSNYGIINVPGGNLIRGLSHLIGGGDEVYRAWRASGGGEGSMLVSLDRRSMQKTLVDVIQSGRLRSIADTIIRHPIDSLRALVNLSEKPTRLGEFSKTVSGEGGLIKENILKGAFEAQEITLPFSRMGSDVKKTGLNQIVAFLNANIQDLDKMARFAKEKPGLFMARGIATITLPTLALYLANKDDPRWQELPRWQKDFFWIVPTGTMDNATWAKMSAGEKAKFNSNHTIWRLPRPFTLGILFGATPERFFEWTNGNDPKALAELGKTWLTAIPNPLGVNALWPLIENMANWKTYFDRKIVPRGKEDVAPAEQYTRGTSEAAKIAGRTIGYSPAKIENVIRGWFGGLGQIGLDVSNKILKTSEVPEPEGTLSDVWMVRRFVSRFPGQAQSIERFYDAYGSALEAKNTYDLKKREGKMEEARSYLKEHRIEIADARRLKISADVLSALRKRAEKIQESKVLSPTEKRQKLDATTFRMIDVAKRAINRKREGRSQTSPSYEVDYEPAEVSP